MQSNQQDRQTLVITGSFADTRSYAEKLVQDLDYLYLKDRKKATDYLGQEFDAVIFPTHLYFDVNALAAIAGTIRGGGYLLILSTGFPSQTELQTPESHFLQRFYSQLEKDQSVHFVSAVNNSMQALEKPIHKKHKGFYATQDQEQLVAEILHVSSGHRRRPLLVTADRGRGKSAALGIAAGQLIADKNLRIMVCAPSKNAAAMIFQHAERICKEPGLQFYSPDELLHVKPKVDLLMVDEAAAIPLPILTKLLTLYSRIVFSSTEYGYEGSGRGFAINFRKILDTKAPGWRQCKLHQPVRWNENDSLETMLFKTLLLNVEPTSLGESAEQKIAKPFFKRRDKRNLLENEAQLQQLFALLISAHYQTKPSDLMQMLDCQEISIYALESEGVYVAVALVILEGHLEGEILQDIFAGTRRLKGHLVAQSLSTNVGIKTAPTLKGARVMRIAVHPEVQGRGLGSLLLEKFYQQSDADYVSSSFAMTPRILDFWHRNGFQSVYLGGKRDASSGMHSVMVMRGKSKSGIALTKQAQENFVKTLPHLLSDPLRNVETDVVMALLADNKTQYDPGLSAIEKSQLKAFAYEQKSYDACIHPIWKLTIGCLPRKRTLTPAQQEILVIKVLEKNDWQKTVQRIESIKGKKQALVLLRNAVAAMLNQ